jgi:hypothetical protein
MRKRAAFRELLGPGPVRKRLWSTELEIDHPCDAIDPRSRRAQKLHKTSQTHGGALQWRAGALRFDRHTAR